MKNFLNIFTKVSAFLAVPLLVAITVGCSDIAEEDRVAEAQACLNKALYNPSALACMVYVEGINTPEANLIRCSAYFVASGVTTPENMSAALNAINNGEGTSTVFSILNLKVSNEKAAEIDGYCQATGKPGIQLISSMARTATIISNLTILGGNTPEEIRDNIETILAEISLAPESHVETVADIGATVQVAYKSACSGGKIENQGICDSIAEATNSTDILNAPPDQIGALLLEYWKSSGN